MKFLYALLLVVCIAMCSCASQEGSPNLSEVSGVDMEVWSSKGYDDGSFIVWYSMRTEEPMSRFIMYVPRMDCPLQEGGDVVSPVVALLPEHGVSAYSDEAGQNLILRKDDERFIVSYDGEPVSWVVLDVSYAGDTAVLKVPGVASGEYLLSGDMTPYEDGEVVRCTEDFVLGSY